MRFTTVPEIFSGDLPKSRLKAHKEIDNVIMHTLECKFHLFVTLKTAHVQAEYRPGAWLVPLIDQ